MREEYETWFTDKFGCPPMAIDSRQIDFCWHGYQAGVESMRQQLAAAQAEINRLNSPVVLSEWQQLEQQLADSQKREVMLRDALWKIAHPIDAMQSKLREGEKLNGPMAVMIASDPSYLKEIAQEALAATAPKEQGK
jgi:tRNA A37 threonylcarbamoyladenosine modification protein TsaB